MPAKILAEVQQEFLYQAGADLHLRNHNFHLKLSKGIDKTWKDANGKDCFEHFYAVNYDDVSQQ